MKPRIHYTTPSITNLEVSCATDAARNDWGGSERWNDPAFGIKWPPGPRIISLKDQQYPDFTI